MEDVLTPEVSGESYVILERLSSGGMGRIYRGVKKGAGGFKKPVVLKQLLPEYARDPEVLELFFREAYIHAALEHANIVHIIDFVTSGQDYFIVMEYVRGTDLYHVNKALKSKRDAMPVAMAAFIAREIFKALDYAHTKTDEDGTPLNIIHRDISPTNVLLSGAGEVKITDFGIAHSSQDSSGFVNVRGKIAYMSPEQARGEPLDQRTDIYSAAVCIYEMIAGVRPLPSFRNAKDLERHFHQPIEPLWRVRPTCPRALDELVRQCLAPDPEDRPSNAGEVLARLERIVNENALFFSARRLADFLKKLLGPDPTQWAKQRAGLLGPRTGESAPDAAASGGVGRRGHVGMEVTSIRHRVARRGLPQPRGGRAAARGGQRVPGPAGGPPGPPVARVAGGGEPGALAPPEPPPPPPPPEPALPPPGPEQGQPVAPGAGGVTPLPGRTAGVVGGPDRRRVLLWAAVLAGLVLLGLGAFGLVVHLAGS